MYVICDLAMNLILTKVNNYDVRDFSNDARIPTMYYQAQPDTFQNTQNYIPDIYLPIYNNSTNNAKKTGIVVPVRGYPSIHKIFVKCVVHCDHHSIDFCHPNVKKKNHFDSHSPHEKRSAPMNNQRARHQNHQHLPHPLH